MSLGIAFIGYVSYNNFSEQFHEQAGNQLLTVANLKVNGLSNWRKERLSDSQLLHENLVFAELVQDYFENQNNSIEEAKIMAWLDSFRIHTEYDRMRLLDIEGQMRLSSPRGLSPISSEVAVQIAEVVESSEVVLVDFYRRNSDENIRLALLIPILDPQTRSTVIGVVAITIDPEIYLYPFIQEWPAASDTAETLLVRRDGNDVLFLNELRFQANTSMSLRIPLDQTEHLAVKAVQGQTGVVEGVDYREHPVIGALKAIPDSPWFLVARMDIAEVETPLRTRLWQTFLMMGMKRSIDNWTALIHPADRVQMLDYFTNEVIGNRMRFDREYRIVRNNDHIERWVHGMGELEVDDQDQLVSMLGTIQDITDSKLAEEALNRQNNLFSMLLKNLPLGVFMVEAPSGKPLVANDAALELLGQGILADASAENLGIVYNAYKRNTHDPYPPEEMPVLLGMTGISAHVDDMEIERPDGTRILVEVFGSPVMDDTGQVWASLASFSDITERKQAEAILHETNEYLDNLFNYANAPIIVWDPQFTITRLIHAFEELTGRNEHEVLGKSIEILFPPHQIDLSLELIRKTQAGERWDVVEIGILHVDGSIRTVLWNSATLFSADGKNPIATIAQGQDITERKQAENMITARLRLIEFSAGHSLKELLEKTLDEVCLMTDSPIGFYHFVESDQLTLSLQAWSTRTMQEYCKAEGYGLHYPVEQAGIWADSVRERKPVIHNDYESLPAALRKGLPEGHATLVRELVVPVLREDQIVAILGVGNKTQLYNQKDVEMVNYFADVAWEIAERKQAEEQLSNYAEHLAQEVSERTSELRDAQEQLVRQERLALMGQLAGSIGHELRNPLGVILNAVYFLKMVAQKDASDKVKEYLTIIENEARASDKIVTDLLDFTRLKSIDREAVSVSDLISETLERFPVPPSVEVVLEISPDLPKVFVDSQHMIQILRNLTVNASQAMASKIIAGLTTGVSTTGRLTLSANVHDEMVRLNIQDTGVGIPPENLPKLFEPLFTTKIKGIGLGLAVSKKLIEANGGRIEVKSEAGVGSIFTIWMPVE
ncbi:MAG: PAS domain S-box protein [Anaerolineales bacterium]|nr:PAS domain S-box protein [Anaerolineales bacterium]